MTQIIVAVVVAYIVLAVVVVAHAQTSTTNCFKNGSATVCETRDQSGRTSSRKKDRRGLTPAPRSFAGKACRYWALSAPAGAGETVRTESNGGEEGRPTTFYNPPYSS